ncbi:hypothetical protein DPMN_092729 [Dreissena polymorpha]|uniref:Uncharacterized protein n=1 Tax=Dreissena polymorpha TaxID=45954 RepID=A0A9D4R1Z5_DREPO|nr:hypothetical protein DPMN_092729 [Dreissena polymorpha]
MSVHSNESRNTVSPSFQLDLDYLLNEFVEADRDDEASQVLFVVTRHISSLRRIYRQVQYSVSHVSQACPTFTGRCNIQYPMYLKPAPHLQAGVIFSIPCISSLRHIYRQAQYLVSHVSQACAAFTGRCNIQYPMYLKPAPHLQAGAIFSIPCISSLRRIYRQVQYSVSHVSQVCPTFTGRCNIQDPMYLKPAPHLQAGAIFRIPCISSLRCIYRQVQYSVSHVSQACATFTGRCNIQYPMYLKPAPHLQAGAIFRIPCISSLRHIYRQVQYSVSHVSQACAAFTGRCNIQYPMYLKPVPHLQAGAIFSIPCISSLRHIYRQVQYSVSHVSQACATFTGR